jgi:hypothetical protein
MRIFRMRTAVVSLITVLLSAGFIYRKDLMMIAHHGLNIWSASQRLSKALDGARSVVFVEFEDDNSEKMRVPANPEGIASLRRATTAWLLPTPPDSAMCWYPHHRVDVVKADGSASQLVICFECRTFQLDDPPWRGGGALPNCWRKSLTALFKSQGMAPWDREDQ